MKDFTPFQQAFDLKELGFDEFCFGRIFADGGSEQLSYPYKNSDQIGKVTSCSASTYSQAFRFFREKYNLFGQVNIRTYFIYDISNNELKGIKEYDKATNTYEEAELACLKKLIEIVKQK